MTGEGIGDLHLRALRAARLRKPSVNMLDTFNAMAEIQRQLSAVPLLQGLLELVVGMVRELTHLHRVMLYQFDETSEWECCRGKC
jgi:light-regulated signal transduction histidine kinase (bacteriophytochrome)